MAAFLHLHRGRQAGVVADQADDVAAFVGLGQAQRHAVLHADRAGQQLRALFHGVGEAVEDGGALGGRAPPPVAVKCAARGGDRAIDIRFAAVGHTADHLTGIRADDLDACGRCGLGPFAVDEEGLVVGLILGLHRFLHS